MAALIAQESTFQADVKSSAGAWGLMQIMPSTGRQVARHLGIRPFTTARLKQPEVNVRIGMVTFSGLLLQYGSLAPALAAYNAGDSRVTRWLAERRDFDQDEFIDDIPFPETQNYVKRILGTAEDYRTLYGSRAATAFVSAPPAVKPAAVKPALTKSAPVKPAAKKKATVTHTKKGRSSGASAHPTSAPSARRS
jgi:soluble lytic murein transglycosylase